MKGKGAEGMGTLNNPEPGSPVNNRRSVVNIRLMESYLLHQIVIKAIEAAGSKSPAAFY